MHVVRPIYMTHAWTVSQSEMIQLTNKSSESIPTNSLHSSHEQTLLAILGKL